MQKSIEIHPVNKPGKLERLDLFTKQNFSTIDCFGNGLQGEESTAISRGQLFNGEK